MGVEDLSALSSEYLFVDPETTVTQKKIVPFTVLQDVETRRRKILKRTELPFWRILGYFEGTCLKAMTVDLLLWLSLTLYVGLRVLLRADNGFSMALDLGDTDITVLGGEWLAMVVPIMQSSLAHYKLQHSSPSSWFCS